LKKLEAIFRHTVLRMLLSRRKISEEMIRMLSTWRHSGFHVFCGHRISPADDTAMENLARTIIRASFSQERMQYLDQEGTVVYRSNAARQPRSSRRWSGWPPCHRIFRTGGSKWSGTMAITAMSHGGNGGRKGAPTALHVSSNRGETKRRSGETGRD
jgi:hypothetical protein